MFNQSRLTLTPVVTTRWPVDGSAYDAALLCYDRRDPAHQIVGPRASRTPAALDQGCHVLVEKTATEPDIHWFDSVWPGWTTAPSSGTHEIARSHYLTGELTLFITGRSLVMDGHTR
jgi:hypothetical protein